MILIEAFLGKSRLSSARAASKSYLLAVLERLSAAFSRMHKLRLPVSSSTFTCIQRRALSLVLICASLSGGGHDTN